MPVPNFINLVNAKPAATVLDNLTTGSPAVQAAISATLNSALQKQLSPALASAPVLAGLAAKINLAPADIVAAKDLTTQAFLKQQLDPMVAEDPAMQQAVDGEIAKLSGTATIGSLLELGAPFQAHPLFKADVPKIAIASILATSPTLAANQQLEADFIERYTSFQGSSQNFWNQLSTSPEFKAVAPEFQFTLQLNALVSNNTPLASALRQQFQPTRLQDLTKLTVGDWTKLLNTPVNGQLLSISTSIPGADRDQQVNNYVTAIMAQIKSDFPTPYIGQAIAVDPVIDLAAIKTLMAANPGLAPSKPLPPFVNWNGADPQRASAAWAALHQEIIAFPTADWKTWISGTSFANPVRQLVADIIAQSPDFNIRTTPIGLKQLPALDRVSEDQRGAVVAQLNSLQRLSRLTLDSEKMYFLQSNGMHSASAIAQIPQGSFLNQYSGQLGGRAAAQLVYSRAISAYALVTNLQLRINEALNGITPAVFGDVSGPAKKMLQEFDLDWATLFGNQSTCQCSECRSVYGAAAYFVDLMQFLKSSTPNADGATPSDILQGRRPDLWYLKLNCENTDTELPYIDLVNEILESYIAFGTIDWRAAKNTPSDATADELRVNPEYTNASAYDSLKAAVYPPSLPFDLPLEDGRTYLDFLGTRRDALMRTFQTNNIPSELAIACEYLKISSTTYRAPLAKPSPDLTSFLDTPIRFDSEHQQLHFWGSMTGAQQAQQKSLSGYIPFREAVDALSAMGSPGSTGTYSVPLVGLPSGVSLAGEFIPIAYVDGNLTFEGTMNWAQQAILQSLATDPSDSAFSAYLSAIGSLSQASSQASNGTYAVPLAVLPSSVKFSSQIPITYGDGELTFSGTMGAGQQAVLLSLSSDSAYQAAVNDLFSASSQSGLGSYSVTLATLPASVTFGGKRTIPIVFTAGHLTCAGTMSTTERDELLALSSDRDFQAAVNKLFAISSKASFGSYAVMLAHLPNGISFPSRIPITYATGELEFSGTMDASDKSILLALSQERAYQAAVNELFDASSQEKFGSYSVPLTNLPANVTLGGRVGTPIAFVPGRLSFIGTMTAAQRAVLLGLSSDRNFQAAVNNLFQSSTSPAAGEYAVQLDALNAAIVLPDDLKLMTAYDPVRQELQFTGPMRQDEMNTLLLLDPDPAYQTSIASLFQQMPTAASGVFSISLASLPTAVSDYLQMPISYHASSRQLTFVGKMSARQASELAALSHQTRYLAAISSLYTKAKDVAGGTTSVPLASLPTGVVMPDVLQSLLSYDPGQKLLHFNGPLPSDAQLTLRALSGLETVNASLNPDFLAAIDGLSAVADNAPITELEILLGASGRSLSQFYGLASGTSNATLLSTVCGVETFLQSTGLAYADLVALLETQFLNPEQSITLKVGVEPCNISEMTIASMVTDSNANTNDLLTFFANVLRFIRLWRKLAWQVWELDLAITALVANDITAKLIVQLAHVKEIQQSLELTVDQTLSFWADINTNGRDSLYLRLFQNKSIVNPVDPAFVLTCAAGNLPSLPPLTYTFMSSQDQISYTPSSQTFSFSGNLQSYPDETAQLLEVSQDPAYQGAINGFATGGPGSVSYSLPSPIALSDSATNEIQYDSSGNQFRFTGLMTDGEYEILKALSNDNNYQLAIDNLYDMQWLESVALAGSSASIITVTEHQNTVLAALQINATDLTALLAGPAAVPDKLDLQDLSMLYRCALLAQGLGLSIADFLTLRLLTGIDPFSSTGGALRFINIANEVQQSSFTIADLSYIYANVANPASSVGPLANNLFQLMSDLQSGLEQIIQTNSFAPDPKGTRLKQVLTSILDANAVSQTLGLVNGTQVYSTPYQASATLPANVSNYLGIALTFDATAQQLTFTGPVSAPQLTALKAAASDPGWQAAIATLAQMSEASTPYSVSLSANSVPANLTQDPIAIAYVSDASGGPGLSYSGSAPMTSAQQAVLLSLSSDAGYQAAVYALFSASAQASGSTMVPIAALPSSALLPVPFSYVSGPGGAPELSYSGSSPMTSAQQTALLSLSSDAGYQAAVNALSTASAQASGSATVSIASLPSGPSLTQPISISFTAGASGSPGLLEFAGSMTGAQRSVLLGLSPQDSSWEMAVSNLYAMSSGTNTPVFAVSMASLPPQLALPGSLTLALSGDGTAQQLQFVGPMTAAEQTTLEALAANDPAELAFDTAIADLYAQPQTFIAAVIVSGLPGFITFAEAVAQLIEATASTAQAKGEFLLQAALDYLQQTQSQNLILQSLSNALALNTPTLNLLLTQILPAMAPAAASGSSMLGDFLALGSAGFHGSYYSGPSTSLSWPVGTSPALDRTDSTIDFDWGPKTPDPSIAGPGFSADWTVQSLVAPLADSYSFSVSVEPSSQSTGQLLLNRQPIINWSATSPTPSFLSSPAVLTPQQPSTLELKYSTPGATASDPAVALALYWTSSSMARTQVDPSVGPVFQDLLLLSRIALLLGTLNTKADEVAYLQGNGGTFAGSNPNGSGAPVPFDLTALPTSLNAYNAAWFNQWERLNSLFTLKATLPSGNVSLFDVFTMVSQGGSTGAPDFYSTLSPAVVAATNWSADQIQYLFTEFGFHAADFASERPFIVMQKCLALVMRLGISVVQLFQWATNAPDDAQALNIQNTVKSKYDNTAWLTVGEPLNDRLRCRRRNVLVAYILTLPTIIDSGVADADGLYEHFLIDVQMAPCMLTSRIVQANAAIQLFLQRCLMNLEPDVQASAIDPKQWAWMQNYRVWEANREVFLYPENYLVPTLRDDITPPFDDLMNSLMQNPITNDNVTQAYADYLHTLKTLAQMQICGSFWQQDTPTETAVGATTGPDNRNVGTINTFHVFGCTASAQPQYYYRQFLNFDPLQGLTSGRWTPWEPVNLQISGNHLIPVVWAGRLYLFWPIFTNTADPSSQGTTSSSSSAPSQSATTLGISLAWSEYKSGTWAGAQTTSVSINPSIFNPYPSSVTLDYSLFTFYTDEDPQSGNLRVWAVYPTGTTPNELANTDFVTDASNNAAPWTGSKTVNFSPLALNTPGQPLNISIGSDGNQSSWPNAQSETVPAGPGQSWTASIWGLQVGLNGDQYQNIAVGQVGIVKLQFLDINGNILTPIPISMSPSPIATDVPGANDFVGFHYPGGWGPFIQGSVTAEAPPATAFVQMQALIASAGISIGAVTFNSPSLTQSTQVVLGNFTFSTCGDSATVSNWVSGPEMLNSPVPDSNFSYMLIDGNASFTIAGMEVGGLSFPWYGSPPVPFLKKTGSYQLLFPQDQFIDLLSATNSTYPFNPFFFSDAQRTYFAVTTLANQITGQILSFQSHWHPFVSSFIKTLNWRGIPGLLTLGNQTLSCDGGVLSGLELTISADNGGLLLSTGILCAQGQPLAFDAQVLSSAPYPTSYLYYNFTPNSEFYYNPTQSPAQQGDAFIGTVVTASGDVTSVTGSTSFERNYQPCVNVEPPYPLENVDFSLGGPYSIYNWELFFHIPLLVATQLSQNQQFQDAKTWFEYFFTPSTNSTAPTPQRNWSFLPFAVDTEPQSLQDLLNLLGYTGTDPQMLAEQLQVQSQISGWKEDPFNPFLIARLRPLAFMKKTVMAYLDNLIAWGDFLFSQNTRESINEATQIYVLAQQILGPRPQIIQQTGPVQDLTYNDIQGQLDAFSNASVLLENAFPISLGTPSPDSSGLAGNASLNHIDYFCIPANDQLLGYWDTVADRLYKIRHCMNIAGQVEQLALFAPPINPALLVQAAAAGIDLSSVLSDINAPTPNYRFTFMLQKALELCSEVRSLGAALLSALEKQDAEKLSLLRATQETQLLQKVMMIKETQVSEANANLAALNDSLAVTTLRQQYYDGLIRGNLSPFETGQTVALGVSQAFKDLSQATEQQGSILSLIPQFEIGVSGISSPVSTISLGGQQLSTLAHMVAQSFSAAADNFSFAASLCSLLGQWDRRLKEWKFQSQSAAAELKQIGDQINAATFRVTIASTDKTNQQFQIDNAQTVQNLLTSKYTNQELYSWMKSQISGIYFQCYQMAYGLAKRAELAFRFDLSLTDSSYIHFGYWNSLQNGLLAAEGLYSDLKAMEIAYLDQNIREYEITKAISLLLLDPMALIALKETGFCFIVLPEELFDMDYPGHYMRRLKSLSLTIPCVAGPYTSVNCTLTLVSNKIRVSNDASGKYQENTADSRFVYDFSATQSIATSTAQNDSGLFEVNFRDGRYLPFEGRGVISIWQLELPNDCNSFDLETISDVVLNLKYTARNGGDQLRKVAKLAAVLPLAPTQSPSAVSDSRFPAQSNLARLFSLRHEFPTEWYKFLSPQPNDLAQSMMIPLAIERLPFQYRGKKIQISLVDVILKFKAINDPKRFPGTNTPLAEFQSGGGVLNVYVTSPQMTLRGVVSQAPTTKPSAPNQFAVQSNGGYLSGSPSGTSAISGGLGIWWLQLWKSTAADGQSVSLGDLDSLPTPLLDENNHLLPDLIEDIFIVFYYSAT